MASPDMEMKVRSQLGVAADQPMDWHCKPCTFSPVVRQLISDNDEGLGVLGSGISGDVC